VEEDIGCPKCGRSDRLKYMGSTWSGRRWFFCTRCREVFDFDVHKRIHSNNSVPWR